MIQNDTYSLVKSITSEDPADFLELLVDFLFKRFLAKDVNSFVTKLTRASAVLHGT